MRAALWIAPLLLAGPSGCGGCGVAPDGVQPGWRLPYEEVSEPVSDWSFAADELEMALETDAPWGWHSVTVWPVVLDGRIYVATDDSVEEKRWLRGLRSDPDARLGIAERAYPVRAHAVTDPAHWDAVLAALERKYGDRVGRYDFPRPGDLESGAIYEFRSR